MNTEIPSFARRRRASLLLPLWIFGTAAGAMAQRFDDFVAAPLLPAPCTTNAVTDPTSGAPTVVAFTATGTDTLAWNGSAFVSLGLTNNPGTSVGETLMAFRDPSAGIAGLVHLDSSGSTSIWTGGPSWTTLGVLSPSPSPRALCCVASEVQSTGEGFLFGGSSSATGLPLADLWSFDGTAWTNRTPTSGPAPSARSGGSLTVNGFGGLLLFGGATGVGTAQNDLWEFRGATWAFAGKGPKRAFHGSLLDVSRGVLTIAGGNDGVTTQNDVWTLPLPRPGIVALTNWTQVPASMPFAASSSLSTAAIDAVRNEFVVVDYVGVEVVHDRLASFLAFAISPNTNCVTPNLQLVSPSPVVQPRVSPFGTTVVPMGGLTGAAGAPMVLLAEFVTPSFGITAAGTPLPGSSCLSFLSGSATAIATTFTLAGGQYQFDLLIPSNPGLVGLVIHEQAFGLFGATLGASQAVRIVVGSS